MRDTLIHLARRGFEAETGAPSSVLDHSAFDNFRGEIPAWIIVFLIIGGLLFVGFAAAIKYTYAEVVATLLMVESPSATPYVPVPADDDSNDETPKDRKSDAPAQDNKVDPELVMLKQEPITSNIFKAEKHLVQRAGSLSRFRGISIAIVTSLITMNLAEVLVFVVPVLPRVVAFIIAQVIAAPLSMAWTHIVISEPSPKYWYSRIPSLKVSKKVVGPTFILAVAKLVAEFLPLYLVAFWGLNDPKLASPEIKQGDDSSVVLKILAVLVVGLAASVLVVIPAKVTLTRVQASLLSEEDEAIVPFDRSFGGRVIPEVLGGSGMIGLLDAWKTFDFNSRIRLVKLYAKVLIMQILATIMYAALAVCAIAISSKQDTTTGSA